MDNDILLVDDEAGIRKVITIALSDLGYTVLTAENGNKALEIFKNKKPSIVLTDIKMPEMDGLTLLEEIKRLEPDAEVILFTGHGDMDLAIKSLKHNAADFITKPIDVEILQISLKRARERILMRKQLSAYTENLEEMVAEKTAKLIEAERLATAGQIVAGLSHTIKHISTGLKGGIYVLETELGNRDYDQLKKGLEMIKGNVNKIVDLSMDLLNYGKYTGLSRQMTDPNEPAMEVANLMKARAQAADIKFDVILSTETNPVLMDPEAIHCCLLNLVANAIDACLFLDEIKKKEIRLLSLPYRGNGVEYRVEDTGCGFRKEDRDKVFSEIFTTKGSNGTGLGLKMIYNIVLLHKGEIHFVSEENKGTTFIIWLLDENE